VEYKHTQFGRVIVGALLFTAILDGAIAISLSLHGMHWMWPLLMAPVFILLLFSTLTVRVNVGGVDVRFGPGWIGKTIPMRDIQSAKVVTYPWITGYGIRFWGDAEGSGWLYNVDGDKAVELKLQDGSRFRIGTDEPELLLAAVESALAARDDVNLDD